MKLPSAQTNWPYIRNKGTRFTCFLLTILLVIAASPAITFSAGTLLPSAQPVVDDDDVIALLGLSIGGRDVAVAAWSNMNLSEKQTLRDHAARIALMAQGAERDGLLSDPDVARALRWGMSSFLADAWEKKVASETDLSEEAARSFHANNRQWYMDSGDRPLPFERCANRVREDMIRSAIMERLKKLNPR